MQAEGWFGGMPQTLPRTSDSPESDTQAPNSTAYVTDSPESDTWSAEFTKVRERQTEGCTRTREPTYEQRTTGKMREQQNQQCKQETSSIANKRK